MYASSAAQPYVTAEMAPRVIAEGVLFRTASPPGFTPMPPPPWAAPLYLQSPRQESVSPQRQRQEMHEQRMESPVSTGLASSPSQQVSPDQLHTAGCKCCILFGCFGNSAQPT